MQIEFTKMHGAGNDVIVFDAPRDGSLPTAAQWRALADRHKGIGFDQAMVIEPL
jgi:diaminopimelate epimerase